MDDRRLTCPASLLHINNSRGVFALNRSWFFGAYLAIVLLSLCAVQIIIDSAGKKDGNSAVLDEKGNT